MRLHIMPQVFASAWRLSANYVGGHGDMDDNKAFWNDYAAEWASNIDTESDTLRNDFIFPSFVSFVGSPAGKTILDLGCGEGSYARFFARDGNQVTGVDYSEEMIRIARSRSEGIDGLSFVLADMSSLAPLPGDAFDIVLAPMCLMDCTNVRRAYDEISRVLKPCGNLYVSLLHPCFFTTKSSWEVQDAKVTARKVACYFATEQALVEWTNSTAKDRRIVKSYQNPYRLEDYINPAVQAGLCLSGISEPPVPREYLAKHGPRHETWAHHAALVLFLHFARS